MGGATAAIAGAAAAKRAREEEEKMTKYNSDDLDGWEFKIVRSNTGAFKNYERVKKVCDEESRAGWEMVEKFDNHRIRFKRRTDNRSGDRHRQGIDPYRTHIGLHGGGLATTIIAVCLAVIGIILAIGLSVR
jgi:hypothetical protein